ARAAQQGGGRGEGSGEGEGFKAVHVAGDDLVEKGEEGCAGLAAQSALPRLGEPSGGKPGGRLAAGRRSGRESPPRPRLPRSAGGSSARRFSFHRSRGAASPPRGAGARRRRS